MKACKDCKHFNRKGCITVFVPCLEKVKDSPAQTGHEMLTTATSKACPQFDDKNEEWGLF